MSKKSKKIKLKLRKFILLFLLILLIIGFVYFNPLQYLITRSSDMYLASSINSVSIYNYDKDNDKLLKKKDLSRGIKVLAFNKEITKDNKTYHEISYDGNKYYVSKENLVSQKKEVVQEKTIYVRTACSVMKDTNSNEIISLAKKNEKLTVISFDKVDKNGIVNTYYIKTSDYKGYVYGKYLAFDKESASKNYEADKYDQIHSQIKNTYGGGEAIKLDFYPVDKVSFSDNKMPEAVYALYLNNGSNVINNIDKYIEFAKDTEINAFVIDIKDNLSPGYQSEVMKNNSPTSYDKAINSYDEYANAIKKLKDSGFYVIGRITVFKDTYFIQDHPELAISSSATGTPYYHTGAYWPSPYERDVWEYNVSLAKEAVKSFGFNEINFDYVRFPDRMQAVENLVDMHNQYQEDKVEVIQQFVRYATDEIHKLNAYVSIDVFGESTNGSYTTAYGQYWPAISNVADVISGMPYPDHFSSGYYGISKPWNNPYKLMNAWGNDAYLRQQECPTPAVVRTWIQAYDVLKYVDSNGIKYNAKELEEEIRGLYDANLTGGYITWLSNSSLEKYESQKHAFQIDYMKEYKK